MMKSAYPQTAVTLLAGLLFGSMAMAQDIAIQADAGASFRISPTSVLDEQSPLLSIVREVENKDFQGTIVEDALNFNLGLQVSPLQGLNVRADAWRLEVDDVPASGAIAGDSQVLPRLYLEDPVIDQFNLDNPLLGSNIESQGFNLGASYVWDTSRFGQFTLSTTATYVQQFENRGGIMELGANELNAPDERVLSPELQSSLTLSWEFGNHTASAITNYFDSDMDIADMDMEAINELVDNITTVDFQYGYSVTTGSNDRAIISFGIKNIFDQKTAQILNSSTRILDQNGRVAYGSIKYQF